MGFKYVSMLCSSDFNASKADATSGGRAITAAFLVVFGFAPKPFLAGFVATFMLVLKRAARELPVAVEAVARPLHMAVDGRRMCIAAHCGRMTPLSTESSGANIIACSPRRGRMEQKVFAREGAHTGGARRRRRISHEIALHSGLVHGKLEDAVPIAKPPQCARDDAHRVIERSNGRRCDIYDHCLRLLWVHRA